MMHDILKASNTLDGYPLQFKQDFLIEMMGSPCLLVPNDDISFSLRPVVGERF